jgi:ribosomal protein S18 acetylase RimI-like enzyme
MMIRLARPDDLAAVRAVEVSAATVFAGTHMDFAANDPPNDPVDLLAAIAIDLMWVATDADAIAGFVFAEPCAAGLYVRELSVAAPYQQRGHGAALMAACIAAARARGDALLLLTTDRTLAWNAPFYRRLGFAIVEGDAIPADAQRRLERQIAAGFDPAQRCAMVMAL